ncbi:MAG TPA: helix-turn-helix domain-containing protein [Acidimicrobiales bacterium]|nr:helix-turn-helix domain-containing protein [Acidimicrobiales bacterium]
MSEVPHLGPAAQSPSPSSGSRREIFKALGDNTRYAIYEELVRAATPLSTGEVAAALGLHPNTIRPHLERMRDAGLLTVKVDSRGSVGRPQHRYAVSAEAPSLGIEPPSYPLLAGLLANVAAAETPGADRVASVGARHGRVLAQSAAPSATCSEGLNVALQELGFSPSASSGGNRDTTIRFTECPYRRMAESFPDLICQLHRGIVEGYVAEKGGSAVTEFATLEDRDPCRVELADA